MAEAVNIRLSVSGAAQAQGDVRRVADAVADIPNRLRTGVNAVGTQIGRLRDLWIGLQGLQLFGAGLRELAQAADTFTSLNARLALATGSTQAASAQFGRLLDIANRMQQPIEEVGGLYISLARSADNLGASQSDMTRFTEGVAASLRLSGSSSQAAAGALQQLSQSMAGSTVQAEEFNSLIDGAPVLLQTVARGLGETGISMGDLRERVRDGKLGTQDFFQAFLRGSDSLVKDAAKLPPTIGGSFTEMASNATNAVGQLDRALGGVSSSIAGAISTLAGVLPRLVEPTAKVLDLALKLGPAVLGYLAALKAAPIVIAAFTAAKTALTGAVVRYQLAVAIAGSHTAVLTGMLGAANAGTLTLTGSVTLLQFALGVLAAAFAGWQIGKWLRENFVEAQLAGIAFVNGTLSGWELVKLGAAKAWAYIKAAWRTTLEGMGGVLGSFLDKLAGGLAAIGLDSAADKMRGWAAGVVSGTRNTKSLADELAHLTAGYDAAKAQIDEITGAMADDAIASFAVKDAHEQQEQQVKKLTTANATLGETNSKLAKAQASFVGDLAKTLADLRESNATFGQGEDAVLAYRASQAGLTEQTRNLRDAIAGERSELQRKTDAQQQAKAQAEAIARTRSDEIAAMQRQAESIAGQITALEDETARMGLSKDALRNLERARLADALASAEQRLQTALLNDVSGEELDAIAAQVTELRKLRQAKEENFAKQDKTEEDDKRKDKLKRDSEEIGDALTDSLMRAFDNGTGFAKAFRDTLVNAFKTMVLQPTIKALVAPIGGFLGQGLSGLLAGAGGGLFSGLSGLIGSLFGGGGADGGAARAGMLYVVNERRDRPAELFSAGGRQYLMPRVDGRVEKGGAFGGGSTVVINQTMHIGQGVSRAEVYTAALAAKDAAKAEIIQIMQRGGMPA